MRRFTRQVETCFLLLSVVALVALVGCGGGGQGFRVVSSPLGVTDANLPELLSGQSFVDIGMAEDCVIPLTGGCGGPYVIAVIEGELPPGITIDVSLPTTGPNPGEPRHHFVGLALRDGKFTFTLQITDTACDPFLTTTQKYLWDIGVGTLKIVGASPAIIPEAAYGDADPTRPGIDALDTTVYGSLVAIDLISAGGVPPYVCSVFDDQSDPLDDQGLPQGVNFAIDSASMVGSPIEVGPNGGPFLVTFQVTDSIGSTSTRKLWWKIDTPPIIIANPNIADGTSGVTYSEAFQVVDGVPPFRYELVDAVPGPDVDGNEYSDIDWAVNPPVVNTIDPLSAGGIFTLSGTGPASNKLDPTNPAMSYPPTGATGPFKPYPSEGLYLVDGDINGGTFTGLPRRAGNFTIFVHAFSTLVPNNRGQHAFKAYSHTIALAPPLAINFAFTQEGTNLLLPGDGFPTVDEAEIGIIYNPDATTDPANGLKFLATGGVQEDGFFDAPHDSQRLPNLSEIEDNYRWTADMTDQNGVNIDGLSMYSTSGQFGHANTATDPFVMTRSLRRVFSAEVSDQQLPDSANVPQFNSFGISVGPDIVIITESTRSLAQTANYWSANQRHEWNDHQMRIKKFQGFSSGPQRQVLDATDLPLTHDVPAIAWLNPGTPPSNAMGTLLSGVTATGGNTTNTSLDLHRPTVVATGWWDDDFALNPKAGRTGKHADWNRGYAYLGQFGNSYSNHGNHQPSVANVDLPDVDAAHINVPAASHGASGIYTNGGRMYVFESSNRFGLFVIREDGKIYVPFALRKNGTGNDYEGFGDGLIYTPATGVNSAFQTVQMTLSPNGRFAAFKLKRNAQNFYENASDGAIVLVSLSGEQCFGETSPGANNGATYKIIGNGVGATGSGNRIQYASSMALTDSHLYFLIGSRSPSGTSSSSTPMYYQSFSGHYFMQYDVLGGATDASLLTGAHSGWYNTSGSPMQTTYHHHGPNYSSYGLRESNSSRGFWPYHRYWQEQGMNLQEHGWAPTPFRVSANGRAVAFLAAQDMYSTSNSLIYSNYAWVCFDGSSARRATGTRRHGHMGSARGYSLVHGPNEYAMWGRYSGPTSGLEIADDGLALAFVYNSNTGTIRSTNSYSSSSHSWMRYRDNILLTRTTGGTQWTVAPGGGAGASVERQVTSSVFGGSHRWRFGALAFTGNTNPDFVGGYSTSDSSRGLIFWAGAPVYQGNTTSYTYNQSYQMAGTFYATAFNATKVNGMLTTTEGGQGTTSYSSFSPSTTSGSSSSGDVASNRRYGVIQPMGGFMSKNRRFLYVTSYGALSTSDATACKLVGLNVSTMNSGSFNSHTNAQGDIPGAWPARRGFMGNYIYYPWYPLYYGYAPSHKQGNGMQQMAKDTGWVFFPANYQYTGPGRYYYYGGPPVRTYYYGAYGYGGVGVYGFNADMNGSLAALHQSAWAPNNTSSTYWGKHQYMEVTRDGSELVYQYAAYYYYDQHNQERIRMARNIDFDTPNGSITGFNASNDAFTLQGSNGRGGEAMAPSTSNANDIWYAFKAGSGNETAREIVRARRDPNTNSWTFTRFSSLPGRMNTLFATR